MRRVTGNDASQAVEAEAEAKVEAKVEVVVMALVVRERPHPAWMRYQAYPVK